MNDPWIPTKLFTNKCHASSDPMNRNHSVISFVSSLLDTRGPVAIVGGIARVIVSTFNPKSWRLWPHVSQKCLERVSPFFTNTNSSTAIITVAFIIGIVASTFNVTPNVVCAAFPGFPRMSVLGKSLSGCVNPKATARLYMPAANIWRSDGFSISALAKANTGTDESSGWTLNHWSIANDFKPSNFGSNWEWFLSHSDGNFIVMFSSLASDSSPDANCDSARLHQFSQPS